MNNTVKHLDNSMSNVPQGAASLTDSRTRVLRISKQHESAVATSTIEQPTVDDVLDNQSYYSSPLDDVNLPRKPTPPSSPPPVTRLLVFTVFFSAITGLLMGYDLCIIALVLHPIEADFNLCPHSPTIATVAEGESYKLSQRKQENLPATSKNFSKLKMGKPTELQHRFQYFGLLGGCCWKIHEQTAKNVDSVQYQKGSARSSLSDSSIVYKRCEKKQWFVSVVSVGGILGSLCAGFVADYTGRRVTVGLSGILIAVGSAIMAFASTFFVLVFGRSVIGCGVGVGFVVFSTYIAEISPAHRRGQLVSCQEIAQCAGCLLAYLISLAWNQRSWRPLILAAAVVAGIQCCAVAFLPESPRWLVQHKRVDKAWKTLCRLSGIPTDSPLPELRHTINDANRLCHSLRQVPCPNYTSKPRTAAYSTLQRMVIESDQEKQLRRAYPIYKRHKSIIVGRARSHSTLHPVVQTPRNDGVHEEDTTPNAVNDFSFPTLSPPVARSLSEGVSSYQMKKTRSEIDQNRSRFTRSLDWWHTLQGTARLCHSHRRQVGIAVGCVICQNLTASTPMLYYSTDILHLVGAPHPYLVGVGIGLAKVAGTITMMLLVDRLGRRCFLLLGSVGISFCHFIFALIIGVGVRLETLRDKAAWIPGLAVATMILYMYFQNMSWASLMFVIASEVLPSSLRGVAMGWCLSLFWVLGFLTQGTWITLMDLLNVYGVFVLYGCTSLLALIFTYYCIPEFSGQSLEHISMKFHTAY